MKSRPQGNHPRPPAPVCFCVYERQRQSAVSASNPQLPFRSSFGKSSLTLLSLLELISCHLMALDSTEGSLKERGVRLTRQRQILLELIDKTGEHLDAERLYELAKEKDPKLNRVTVYRTLKMLKAGGLVDELDLMHYGGDQHYYETRLKQVHAHVICLRCGKVEEFFGEPLQRLRKQIESHFGFQVLIARTEI